MKRRLTNRSEASLYSEISDAVSSFGGDIYRRIRVADVVDIDRLVDRRLGRYALQAHFDVCVGGADEMPAFAIEFDGTGHDSRSDNLKDQIARETGLALFRVDETLLFKSCGGMTFLQYLVHLWFMGLEFRRMQMAGDLDQSEPFMMSGFLKPNARNIFDSEYDFTRAPTLRIGALLRRAGLEQPPLSRAMLSISNVIFGRDDTSLVGFASMPFGNTKLYGRAKLAIGTPSLGELAELPFGWMGLADFLEGMILDDLCDNGEIILANGIHAVSCCRFRGHEVKLPALAVRSPWG